MNIIAKLACFIEIIYIDIFGYEQASIGFRGEQNQVCPAPTN